MGTYLTIATPSVATISASVATAANAPTRALRQLIVTPTTSTIVNASTNSTAEARKAAIRTAHCMNLTPDILSKEIFWPYHNTCSYYVQTRLFLVKKRGCRATPSLY